MNYIEEKPMSDLIQKIIDYCYSDNKSKLTAKDVIFMVMDCTVEHTVEDVQPVKHGKWLISSDGYYPYCSECGKEPKSREMTKFCAECGAKMDKEEMKSNA